MYLEKIESPQDLKKLNGDACVVLAEEIRNVIVKKVSKAGGHLSSNLGIVELIIALHYVFDSPIDKIVFDTSHQTYVHKILTGRKDGFMDEINYKKYSGYTNPDESEHDLFKFGHTSTAISLACGLVKARDLLGRKENVIAVIGDGALGGGEALAGLNYAGRELNSNLIVVLNDNQMSIAENYGALYSHLNELRESKGRVSDNIFSLLGYDYRYVSDGNDVQEIISVLSEVKDINHPVVVHISTVKGKGFETAEQYKEDSHFVRPFDINKGITPARITGERYDKIVRDFLLEKIKKDSGVAVMLAAVPNVLAFDEETRKMMGQNYIDVGITEEHAISMAAGIVKNGGKPIFATRSTFIQRCYDQISQELGINKLAVTIILVNASVYVPTDETHMGVFDIPMLSNIPNIVFLAPANKQEYLAMLEWSIEQNEYPVIIRAPRNGVHETNYVVDTSYAELNQYKVVRKGEDIAIIAAGDFFQLGEEVADILLETKNKKVTLINPRFVSGVDYDLLDELKEKHTLVITLEDGVLEGGFGQKIAAYYGKTDVKVMNFGLKKEFVDYYNTEEILRKNKLKPEMIIKEINALY